MLSLSVQGFAAPVRFQALPAGCIFMTLEQLEFPEDRENVARFQITVWR